MCGITGVWAFNEVGRFNLMNLEKATQTLSHRGPDNQDIYQDHFVGLGHRRLSIIDTSENGHQPFSIDEGRYVITFNGEIFNYKELRQTLIAKGVQFKSDSDTEVLLQLYAHEGKSFLEKLNGFFAFAIYDNQEKSLFIARDRMGIKPLLYFQDEFKVLFASELQAVLTLGVDVQVDQQALNYYLQLNYTPAPLTMVEGVKKLEPGHCIEIKDGQVTTSRYYDLPERSAIDHQISFSQAKDQLRSLMDASVQRRMISDVPLGCFLSGGIDSSVITAIASQHTEQLSTFSIGFKDNKFFDETSYAELVAKKFKTNHTTFRLSQEEITAELGSVIDHLDEPFADSSAILVNMLCKKTKEKVTVALSGDGADEIFSGYNKHAAWYKMDHSPGFGKCLNVIYPWVKKMPQSRSGKIGNALRQVVRYVESSRLSPQEKYWFMASFATQATVDDLLVKSAESNDQKDTWLKGLSSYTDMNDMLRMDTNFVLPHDMLKKVDAMSMANSLEVRVPFLDHELLDFVFRLPEHMKINGSLRKRILQDAYRDVLPEELYNRPKKGFEMPLLDWLKTSLKVELDVHLFDRDKIEAEGYFQWSEIERLQKQLFSNNPGDSHARVWGLYIFQKWKKKYL